MNDLSLRTCSRVSARCGLVVMLLLSFQATAHADDTVDLATATVVIRSGKLPKAERTAAEMFVEELEKRVELLGDH